MRVRFAFRLTLFIYGLFGLLLLTQVQAQTDAAAYNYSFLTINEGLCDNYIRAIHKDSRGFMWIGTSNGLERYDGYELRTYSSSSVHPNQFIESNYIFDIAEDTSQYLWVASDAGIMRINLQKEEISFLKEYKGDNYGIISSPVQTIYIDEAQNLVIGKSDCLAYVILNSERNIEEVKVLKNEVDIRTIVKHENEIWAGGKNHLLRYVKGRLGGYAQIQLPSTLDFSNKTINTLFSLEDLLWIGTRDGLYCTKNDGSYFVKYQHNPDDYNSLSSNYVTDISRIESGEIIVATWNGVNILKDEESFLKINKLGEGYSLNDNVINRLFVDEQNGIWVGSVYGGLNILYPQKIRFSHSLQADFNQRPLVISSVLEDNNGNLLVGIVDRGLAVKLRGKEFFNFYYHQDGNPSSLSNNNVSDIVQDLNGDYWISTIGGGLNKLKRDDLLNPSFAHYTIENSGLLSEEIRDLELDTLRSCLWICSGSNIQILDLPTEAISQFQFYTQTNLALDRMNTIFVDSESRLWVGGNGVYIADLKERKEVYEFVCVEHKLDDPDSKIKEKITCIIETKDGAIYLGSMGNGLYELEQISSNEAYTFRNYSKRSGLPDISVSGLVEDFNGNIWISTIRGVYCFNTTSKRAVKFDEEDGLPVQQFSKRAACATGVNAIVLGTANGLISFYPMTFPIKTEERKVALTGLYRNGVEMIPFPFFLSCEL